MALADVADTRASVEVCMSSMVESFQYVRGVYRTSAQLLQASDALVIARGFKPQSWTPLYNEVKPALSSADRWLWHYAQRHARNGGRHLVLTTMFYDPWDTDFAVPLCIASTFGTASTGYELYALGMALAWWKESSALGTVHEGISVEALDVNNPEEWGTWIKSLTDPHDYRAVGCRLDELRSLDDLESKLLRPLLGSV